MLKTSILLTLLILLAGCVTVETEVSGRQIQSESVMQIKPGVTTRSSAIDLFGNPTEISNSDGVETLLYVYKEERTPVYFGGMVQLDPQKKNEYKSLELVIKDGIVDSYRFKTNRTDD